MSNTWDRQGVFGETNGLISMNSFQFKPKQSEQTNRKISEKFETQLMVSHVNRATCKVVGKRKN